MCGGVRGYPMVNMSVDNTVKWFFNNWPYTGWPIKNATTLIVNFMNIVDETELFFMLFGRTFIFQQNDTMIISFG